MLTSKGMPAQNMQTYIEAVPGWDSTVFGVQFGVLVAVLVILTLGMVGRGLIVTFLPRMMKKIADERQGFENFQITSRFPLGAAAAGFIWWHFFTILSTTEGIILNGEFIFWVLSLSKAAFLIGGLLGAIRLVEFVEVIARLIDDDGELDGTQVTLIDALQSVLKLLIFVVGVVLIADGFGFDLGAIIAGLGIGGLAFAFAAKDTISNIFGALTLLLDRPFKIGDWIKVGSSEGEVVGIGVRTTILRTSNDTVITLPNGKLVNKDIENYGKRRWRRYRPVLSLDLNSDSKSVEQFCRGVEELISAHEGTTKKEDSFAKVSAISKDSIEISLNVYWIEGGEVERNGKEGLLLDIAALAQDKKLRFHDPRVRSSSN